MCRVLIVVTRSDEFRRWNQGRALERAWDNSVGFYEIAVGINRIVVVGWDPQRGESPYVPIGNDDFVRWVNNISSGNRVGILKHYLKSNEQQTVKSKIQNLEFIESYSSNLDSWYSELQHCCTTPNETIFDSLWRRFTDTHWLMYRVLIPIFAEALKNPGRLIRVGDFLDQHQDIRKCWDRFWSSVSDRRRELENLESLEEPIQQVFVMLRDAMLDAMRRPGG